MLTFSLSLLNSHFQTNLYKIPWQLQPSESIRVYCLLYKFLIQFYFSCCLSTLVPFLYIQPSRFQNDCTNLNCVSFTTALHVTVITVLKKSLLFYQVQNSSDFHWDMLEILRDTCFKKSISIYELSQSSAKFLYSFTDQYKSFNLFFIFAGTFPLLRAP